MSVKLIAMDLDGTLSQHKPGGNDESVYKSEFGFITIDDYRTFPDRVKHLL